MDEVEVRKCYVDVDRKFKGQHGITLTIPQWRKLIKVVGYINQKIKAIQESPGLPLPIGIVSYVSE